MSVLKTELRSAGLATNALTHWAISLSLSPWPYYLRHIPHWSWNSSTHLEYLTQEPQVSSCLHLPQSGSYRHGLLSPLSDLGAGDGSGPHVYTSVSLPESSPQAQGCLDYHVCSEARRQVIFPTICSATVSLFSGRQSSRVRVPPLNRLGHLLHPLLLRSVELSPMGPWEHISRHTANQVVNNEPILSSKGKKKKELLFFFYCINNGKLDSFLIRLYIYRQD